MKVLFAASECVPFVKTGGLADVVGALPKRLRDLGVDVRVMLPMYSAIEPKWREKMEHVLFFYVNLGWRHQYVGVQKLEYEGITFYFIDRQGKLFSFFQCYFFSRFQKSCSDLRSLGV